MESYIKLLGLEKHVEGGYFGVFYKSQNKIEIFDHEYENKDDADEATLKKRSAGSSIYFLLQGNDFSAWHRLKSDEIWHYYDGNSPVDIHVINEKGEVETYTLGNPGMLENAKFQVVVKAGNWFAAEVRDKTTFALVGCTVAPGFEYADFELAKKDYLIDLYPHLAQLINKFIYTNRFSDLEIINENTKCRKNQITAEEYIKMLNLNKHIEGGCFVDFYKSSTKVIPVSRENLKDSELVHRSAASSIYFLLEKQDFSAWHCLKSDEIWHYYDGLSPVDIHVIDSKGCLKTHVLGHPERVEGASFQVVIQAGNWFAAEVRDKMTFALVGCTVSPGFEYKDFELADRKKMISKYPQHQNIIRKWTRYHSPVQSWSSIKYVTLALISGVGFYLAKSKLFNAEKIDAFADQIKSRLGI